MELVSDKKTFAEAVTGSTSFGAHSWSHLQTQNEEQALVLEKTALVEVFRYTCAY